MKPISLCITTFARQDLLGECLRSAFAGTVKPERVYIVDQAANPELLEGPLSSIPVWYKVIDLGEKRGCEGSAVNWYLQNVQEERVVAHEDVVFGTRSLELFVATAGAFVLDSQLGLMNYRDPCLAAGLYDPKISPNYFRYVDVDYEDRLALIGIHPTIVECGLWHLRDGTMKGLTGADLEDYHRREHIAATNYHAKWGRGATPGGNSIGRGFWRRENMAALGAPKW